MKRKFISVILSLILTAGAVSPITVLADKKEYEEADDPIYCSSCADTDGDGDVTVADARNILRAAVGLDEIDDDDFGVYDVNANGTIGVDDARDALRMAVGITERAEHAKGKAVILTEATCSSNGKGATLCAYCGKIYNLSVIPNPGHVSNGRKLIKKATCTEKGIYEYRCKFCDKLIKEEYVDTIEHDWQGVKITCLAPKNSVLTCKNCGATKTIITESPGHHEYVYKITKEATCTENGEKIRVCRVCGEKADEEPTVIPNLGGHRLSDWRTVSTVSCNVDGREIRVCLRCGDTVDEKITPKYEHTRKEGTYVVDEPATCSSEGKAHFTCSECLKLVYTSIPRTAHTSVPGTVPTVISATCKRAGSISGECVNCGHYTESIPKLAHRPASGWTQTVAATCTEKGKEARYCTECGEIVEERETEINKANHDYELSGTIEPTCTKDGATLYTCTRCGATHSTPIGATGHTEAAEAELIEEREAQGFDIYGYRCIKCGEIVRKEMRPHA